MSPPSASANAVEQHTISHVPLSERHGKVRDLFTMWFGTNIAPLPLVTGAVGVEVFHLSFWWCVFAVIVGNLVGGVFMALHSAQGPQLGVPQMLQSRAQFGSYGALLIVIIAAGMYVAFFASNIVLAGQSMHGILPGIPLNVGIVLGALGSAIICIIGYRLIHALNKIATLVLGLGVVAGLVVVVARGLPADFFTRGGVTFAGWLATVSLGALWQLAFAPYVSDYSRYLPTSVRTTSTFQATYWGSCLGSMLSFLAGTTIALASPLENTMAGFGAAAGAFGPVVLLLFFFNVLNHNALNLYGAVLALITTGQTFRHRWAPRARTRAMISVVVFAASVLVAVGLSTDFVAHFVNIVMVLLVVLVPWTAINLIDYYLIHHGRYDLNDLFDPDGGRYGRFNRTALVSYGIGIVVQIPFMATDVYTGPLVPLVGGADLSWLIGLLVTSPLYYALARRAFSSASPEAAAEATAAPVNAPADG